MEGSAAGEGKIGPIQRAMKTAKRALSEVQEKSAELGSSAHEKATDLQAGFAAQFEAGAQSLRHPTGEGDEGIAGPVSDAGTATRGLVPKARARVASGFEDAADYLYRHDLTDWVGAIRRQTQARPWPALFVALGVGLAVGILSRRGTTRRL
jgi:hypothetical protein